MPDVDDDSLTAIIVSLRAKLAAHEATIASQKIIIGKHEACAAALRPHLKQMDEMMAATFAETEPVNVPDAPTPIDAVQTAPGHQKQPLPTAEAPAESNESASQHIPAPESDHDDSKSFVVLECGNLRVHRASPLWLRFFGFRRTESEGRSLRICFGPGTDTGVIDGLLRHVAEGGQYNGIWSKIVLYKNSGEEQHGLIQAALEQADEGDEDAPKKARLIMRAVQSSAGLPTPPSVTISADEPYAVLDSNQVCVRVYGHTLKHKFAYQNLSHKHTQTHTKKTHTYSKTRKHLHTYRHSKTFTKCPWLLCCRRGACLCFGVPVPTRACGEVSSSRRWLRADPRHAHCLLIQAVVKKSL